MRLNPENSGKIDHEAGGPDTGSLRWDPIRKLLSFLAGVDYPIALVSKHSAREEYQSTLLVG